MLDKEVVEMYGEKELRWYQIAAINETINCLNNGVRRILICLPTGAGKTITMMATFNRYEIRHVLNVGLNEKIRVLFIAHNHRLLTQAERTVLDESNIELITQSVFSNIPDDVIKTGWHIAVIDEAAHEAASSFQFKLDDLIDKPVIGLTATNIRADNFLLKFEHTVHPISREQAVAEGFLSPTHLYSVVTPPSKTKTDIIKDILNTYAHNMNGTLIFMRTKAEVAAINNHLISMGYKSIAVLNQSKTELDDILDTFSKGNIQFLVSCNKLGEGIDVKNCSCVVLGRTVGSYPLLNQIIGRASRPDCDCHVYELINPLSAHNLDSTVVVGTPKEHKLIFHRNGQFHELEFDYTSQRSTVF